jgi:hypothetical protein
VIITDRPYAVPEPLRDCDAPDLPLFDLLGEFGNFYPVNADKKPLKKPGKAAIPKLLEKSRLAAFHTHKERTGWGLRITSPHFVVVDCESPSKKGSDSLGPDGMCHFRDFWISYIHELPRTLTVESGSGGRHFYFTLPVDVVPQGQHLKTRISALPGVDVITYGNRIILPESQVTVRHGSGKYRLVEGLDAGIAEMPRPLALAFAKLLGFEGLNSSKSRPNRKSMGKKRDVVRASRCSGPCDGRDTPVPNKHIETIVGAMLKRFQHMPKLWAYDVAAKSGDQSVSGFEYNIAKLVCIYGCDAQTTEAVVRHWHDLHEGREGMKPFNPKRWGATLKDAAKRAEEFKNADAIPAEESKKREEEEDVVQKVSKPRTTRTTTEICPDFHPVEPSSQEQEAFHAIPKAVRTLTRQRSDLDQDHTDCPEQGDWKLTRSYLLGIAFQARSLGFSTGETVWFWLEHCHKYAPDFPLTQRRMETLMLKADGRVRAIRTQRENRKASVEAGLVEPKKRKPRSDRGSSKRLRQVARAREKGRSLGQIAKDLGLKKSTVQGYVEEINARGGPGAVLRPGKRSAPTVAPSSEDAALLVQVCRASGYNIQVKVANNLSRKLRDYQDQTGFQIELTASMIQKALHDPVNRTSKNLLVVLQLMFANKICEQDAWIKALALRIRQAGLPIARFSNGSPVFVVSRMDLPAAACKTCCIRRELRSFVGAADFDFDVEDIWKKAADLGSMRWAIEFAGRECASAWIARGDAECEGELLAA